MLSEAKLGRVLIAPSMDEYLALFALLTSAETYHFI